MLTIDKRKRVEQIENLLYELAAERARLIGEIKESDERIGKLMNEASKAMYKPFRKESQ